MESNPEEFTDIDPLDCRWAQIILKLKDYAPKEDFEILNAKLSEIFLDSIHKNIMQELCAPEQGELEFNNKVKDWSYGVIASKNSALAKKLEKLTVRGGKQCP
jgi:hypothetical protein